AGPGRRAHPKPGERLLVITTQVFVPFQTFDGLRRLYLPFGTDIDTVGYGAEWGDRPLTPEYLLQETLSAIRSGRRLLIDAAKELMRDAGTVANLGNIADGLTHAQDLKVCGLTDRRRARAELIGHERSQAFVGLKRLRAASGRGVRPHQQHVGRLTVRL